MVGQPNWQRVRNGVKRSPAAIRHTSICLRCCGHCEEFSLTDQRARSSPSVPGRWLGKRMKTGTAIRRDGRPHYPRTEVMRPQERAHRY